MYLDAGGRAGETRIWGGLAVFGGDEITWIESVLKELRARPDATMEARGEVKGRDVSLEAAKAIGRRVRDEDRRIAFWAARHRPYSDGSISGAKTELGAFLNELRSDPSRLDQQHVNEWFASKSSYYSKLKAVNQHKLVALISHLQWLFAQLRATGTASRLGRATLVIDREDFPQPVTECGALVKAFMCSGLQGAGMSYRTTGRAMKEATDEGAVVVEVHGDSSAHAGLQLVDILLQVVQRQLQDAAPTGEGEAMSC